MRVLMVHNYYQIRGGEDVVFEAEVDLLRSSGVHVDTLVATNDEIAGLSGRLGAAAGAVYSRTGRNRMAEALARTKPDVVHVHNFFPLLSPALFDACAEAGVPAVITLHNYRLACANGLFLRNDGPCEKCLDKGAHWGAIHGCYRDSHVGSLMVAAMIAWHRRIGTWRDKVSRFIALTEFSRGRFIAAGLPAEKIVVKPNFLKPPHPGQDNQERRGAVFVGRLSREKGVHVLLEAWRNLELPLTIVGDGPEAPALRTMEAPGVRFTGALTHDEALTEMNGAEVLIMPSIWYENLPMTIVEAKALGLPIIASRLGSLSELVRDGVDGFLFNPGHVEDLVNVISRAFADRDMLAVMGQASRASYEERFTPERNVGTLLEIYEDAMRDSAAGTAANRSATEVSCRAEL